MNGYERTVAFVNGTETDHPPFMPLIIDWAAKQAGADYIRFVRDPALRADVYLEITRRFHIDCILPDSDFFEQLEDFGMELEVKNGRYHGIPIIRDLEEDAPKLQIPEIKPGTRMGNRLETLKRIAAEAKGEKYIFGTCVGPFTEFCNARDMQEAMMDLISDEDLAMQCIRMFYENGRRFIEAQLDAGADGIQIVEPCCSLISQEMYLRLIHPLHKELVALSQSRGGFARLHICGDTNQLVKHTLATGTRILDVDSAVRMDEAAAKLSKNQVLCGNLDPSGVVLSGTPEQIRAAVGEVHRQTGGRAILSGGCDIPEDTSVENMTAFYEASAALK